MKKRVFAFILLSLMLVLTSCFLLPTADLDHILSKLTIDEENQEVSENFYIPKTMEYFSREYAIKWEASVSEIALKETKDSILVSVDVSAIEDKLEATLTATIKEENKEASRSFIIYLVNPGKGVDDEISFTKKTFDNRLDTDGPLTECAFPSTGTPKLLVIPVNLRVSNATAANLEDIKIAFSGTAQQTGWESVKSYYKKSSYGKLDMQVDVIEEWFTPKYSASYYNRYSDDYGDGSTLILKEALKYYDSRINYKDYDYDNDGYIDGVWLIYNYEVDFENDNSLFWAFTYWNYQETKYDGVKSFYYAWAGLEFMHPTKEEAGNYDPSDIKVDAHTYIHETGHMLGLDDYYDYDEFKGANGYGFYGCDMMDYNVGDHAAISKLLLGWVSPTVVIGKGSISIELTSFTTTGDFLIVTDHNLTSIYDTYWTIEFYTNDGLNAHDKPYDSATAPYGIRIMEIHAQKNIVGGKVVDNSGEYQTGFKYDNSDESIMFADGIYASKPKSYNQFSIDARCLYQVNEQMKKAGIPFELVVTSMDSTKATVTIAIK